MKPKKFLRAGVHLPVADLQKTIDYYRDKLGFGNEWTWPDKSGSLTDGGICRDEMRLLFGVDPVYVAAINTNEKRLNLLWFVDNLEEIFTEFQLKGIQIVNPPTDYPYGLREFAFIDINGYYIRVAEGKE